MRLVNGVRDLLFQGLTHFPLFLGIQKTVRKVIPQSILAFNQPDSLFAPPGFDLLLSSDGVPNIAEYFQMHESKNSVPLRKSRNQPLSMLDQPTLDIACHAGVEISRPAGQNVNVRGPIHFRQGKADPSHRPRLARSGSG
jgi:hypothetical protein